MIYLGLIFQITKTYFINECVDFFNPLYLVMCFVKERLEIILVIVGRKCYLYYYTQTEKQDIKE